MIEQWRLAFGVFVLSLSGSAAAQTRHFDFSLLKGAGTPVCDAYVERLNQSEFTNYPFCDRPEDDRVAGFERLNRVPLSVEEVERLYDAAASFTRFGDSQELERRREARRRRGAVVGVGDAAQAALDNESRARQGRPFFYRFDPKVDIDNDGSPDDIVVWKDTGVLCGSYSPVSSYRAPDNAPTFLIVLDSEGNLDAAKTLILFGHPRGHTYASSRGVDVGGYRPIGLSMGVLVFDSVTYFDTFYVQSDLENQRTDGEPSINSILAVLQRTAGNTSLLCEIHYRGPYQDPGFEK